MFSTLGADAVNAIVNFIGDLLGSLTFDQLFYIFVGIIAGIILISGIRLIWCYENRAIRAMRSVNKYLKNNPKVTDDNLVEFHSKMKQLPRRMRDRWQLFMLEREGSPSRYMTVEYCVKRPLYNSAVLMSQKQVWYLSIILAILGFIFGLSNISINGLGADLAGILLNSFVIPAIVLILGSIYVMILQIRYNAINHDFYDMFTNFVRNIDKATNTMPDYVDYELLFTKKEINKGIPVLREYLEKRAMEEQRLLEKAKREEVNHSPYDFSSLGVNGAQLIERAVNESEQFLTHKIQLQNEINDLEKQVQKSDANMEDIEREANKKLQAIKENLERLDKAMNETTNRVEISYNRRQASAEMDKKLMLEKDLENMLNKEKVAQDALKVEIQKRKEEIEENKKEVEEALKSEYDTFATKVYDELNEKITRDNSEQLHEMEMTIARLKAKVKEFTRDIEKKDSLIEARNLELDNMRQQVSKQKGKSKSKKDFGQDYIKAQDNVPEGTINAVQVDYNDTVPQENQVAEIQNAENYAQPNEQYDSSIYQPTEPQYDVPPQDNQPDYAGYDQYNQPYDNSQYNGEYTEGAPYNYDGQQYAENGEPYNYEMPQGDAQPVENGEQNGENGDLNSGQGELQPENAQNFDNQNANYDAQNYDVNGYYDQNNVDYNNQYGQPYQDAQNYYAPTDQTGEQGGIYMPEDTTDFSVAENQANDGQQYAENGENAPVENVASQENIEGVPADNVAPQNVGDANGEQPVELTPESAQQQAGSDELVVSDENVSLDNSANANTDTVNLDSDTISLDEAPVSLDEQSPVSLDEKANKENESETISLDESATEPKNEAKESEQAEVSLDEKKDSDEIKPAKKTTAKKFTDGKSKSSDTESEKKDEKADKDEKGSVKDDKAEKDDSLNDDDKGKKADKDADKQEPKESKKKYVENDDLEALQKKIEEENARLKKQQEELRAQIDKTLATMEKAENATKAERTRNIKKIKEMIAKLKEEAETAKARGASKTQINKINKSAAELLKVLADYQSKK